MINFYLHTWIAVRGLISRRRLKHYSLRRDSVFSNGWPCTFMTLDENFFLKTTSMTAYTPTRVHFGPGGVCWFFIRFMGAGEGGWKQRGMNTQFSNSVCQNLIADPISAPCCTGCNAIAHRLCSARVVDWEGDI